MPCAQRKMAAPSESTGRSGRRPQLAARPQRGDRDRRGLLAKAIPAGEEPVAGHRMDATTSDQLMLDCGIAHRAVLLSSDVVSVRGKDSIGHARPAAFAGPIQPILPIATSRSCCKPRDGP